MGPIRCTSKKKKRKKNLKTQSALACGQDKIAVAGCGSSALLYGRLYGAWSRLFGLCSTYRCSYFFSLFRFFFFLCRRFCLCCGLSYVTHNCSSVSLNLTRYAIYHSLHIFMTLPLVHGQAFLAHTSGTHSRHGRTRTRKWCVTVVA